MGEIEHVDTIVIGGGQTGLVVGYELARRRHEFVILDASERIGDAWRKRWDSLMLFTPARFNGLPGMRYPGPRDAYVSKDEIADFLESYAKANELRIRSNVWVDHVGHDGQLFTVETSQGTMTADNIVVAMADYQIPKVPSFGSSLRSDIVQIHSSHYQNISQLRDGPTLIVGLGNSGADIGLEVARNRETYIAGDVSAVVPFRLESWFGRMIGVKLVRFVTVKVLNTSTPIGRRARPRMLNGTAPLVRVKPEDLTNAGATRVPRISGVRAGLPETDQGNTLDVANVIWCTGFEPGFSWIDLPIFDESGKPKHIRGVVHDQPGLYFCGLYFLHALWSETITGVPTDARHVVEHLLARERQPQPIA
jgi:putative flavoprotein involved in K+ transport